MKYTKKPVEIEAITFDEFIQYGINSGANIVNGMPWSFHYNGHPVTHENDKCYLIPTLEGTHNFTPDDMLITGVKGEIYPCKKDIFALTYEQESVERFEATEEILVPLQAEIEEMLHKPDQHTFNLKRMILKYFQVSDQVIKDLADRINWENENGDTDWQK